MSQLIDVLLGLAAVAIVFVVSPLVLLWTRRATLRRAWGHAAEALELEHTTAPANASGVIQGERFGVVVRVESFAVLRAPDGKRRRPTVGTRIVATTAHPLPESFAITPATGAASERIVKVHDDRFDRGIHVEGPEVEVVGMLDGVTRRLLWDAITRFRIEVRDNQVRFVEHRGVITLPRRLERLTRLVVDVARRLGDVAALPPAARLADNVTLDRHSAVRRRNLDLLLAHFPGSPETAAAMKAALRDRDPSVRARAEEAGQVEQSSAAESA
jgi:hypothetical protein